MPEKKEPDRYFASYRGLWRISFKIHSLGNWTLPRAIPVDKFLVFLAVFPLMWLPGKWLGAFFGFSPWMVAPVLSVAAVIFIGQFDPEGRSLAVFVYDLARFPFRPRRVDAAGRPFRLKRVRVAPKAYWF